MSVLPTKWSKMSIKLYKKTILFIQKVRCEYSSRKAMILNIANIQRKHQVSITKVYQSPKACLQSQLHQQWESMKLQIKDTSKKVLNEAVSLSPLQKFVVINKVCAVNISRNKLFCTQSSTCTISIVMRKSSKTNWC